MYDSIIEPFIYESIIKKSKFIVTIIPVQDELFAREQLSMIRKQYHDATHNCSTFRIGYPQALEQSSDDGEPSGTAGRPMLNALQQNHITDVLAIVTRYFGGIKLGAGGLVRAYGGTLADAIAAAPIIRYTPHIRHHIALPYDRLGSIENAWDGKPYRIVDRAFADDVTITVDIPSELSSGFATEIIDLTAARATVTIGDEQLIPLPRPVD